MGWAQLTLSMACSPRPPIAWLRRNNTFRGKGGVTKAPAFQIPLWTLEREPSSKPQYLLWPGKVNTPWWGFWGKPAGKGVTNCYYQILASHCICILPYFNLSRISILVQNLQDYIQGSRISDECKLGPVLESGVPALWHRVFLFLAQFDRKYIVSLVIRITPRALGRGRAAKSAIKLFMNCLKQAGRSISSFQLLVLHLRSNN